MLKDVLKIDLNAVTEDDYIQFTENTVKESQIYVSPERVEPFLMSKTTAAIKIQRAWRNFQTLKVVKKYYEYYRGVMRKETYLKDLEQQKRHQNEKTVKKETEHKLKIRKKEPNSPNTVMKIAKPVNRALDFSENMNHLVTKEIMRESYELGSGQMQTIELPVLKDTQMRS